MAEQIYKRRLRYNFARHVLEGKARAAPTMLSAKATLLQFPDVIRLDQIKTTRAPTETFWTNLARGVASLDKICTLILRRCREVVPLSTLFPPCFSYTFPC